jgi:hypothetical protein
LSDDLFLDAFDEPMRIVAGAPNQQPNAVKELKDEELEVGSIFSLVVVLFCLIESTEMKIISSLLCH